MAGDWIKWTKGLASRREVGILSTMLGRDRHEIAGRLMVLWEWCDDNTTVDASEPSLDVSLALGDRPFDFLDALLGLPGMAEALASAGVRWLEARSGGRVVFPNLARHNGTSAKTRALDAAKKKRKRVVVPIMSPETSRKCPDDKGTKSGPEKRREEKSKETTPLPPSLDSERFRSAFAAWVTHRGKKATPTVQTMALKKLEAWGESRAVAALEHSISNGWAGIFEPEERHGGNNDTRNGLGRPGRAEPEPGKYAHLTRNQGDEAPEDQAGSDLFGPEGSPPDAGAG